MAGSYIQYFGALDFDTRFFKKINGLSDPLLHSFLVGRITKFAGTFIPFLRHAALVQGSHGIRCGFIPKTRPLSNILFLLHFHFLHDILID